MEAPMQLSSFALIEKGDRYLLIRDNSKEWNGHWFFPGGMLNEDENPEFSVQRQTEEATGFEVSLTGIFFFPYYGRLVNHDVVHIYYVGKPKTGKSKKISEQKDEEFGWFTYEEILRLPMRENFLDIINAYRKKKFSIPLYDMRASFAVDENFRSAKAVA